MSRAHLYSTNVTLTLCTYNPTYSFTAYKMGRSTFPNSTKKSSIHRFSGSITGKRVDPEKAALGLPGLTFYGFRVPESADRRIFHSLENAAFWGSEFVKCSVGCGSWWFLPFWRSSSSCSAPHLRNPRHPRGGERQTCKSPWKSVFGCRPERNKT